MLGQIEDIFPSNKKSMTNQRKKVDKILMLAHSCFKQFLWKNKGANCASMMSTVESPKLLHEFLHNLFETKLDGFTFTYLNKLEIKSLLE